MGVYLRRIFINKILNLHKSVTSAVIVFAVILMLDAAADIYLTGSQPQIINKAGQGTIRNPRISVCKDYDIVLWLSVKDGKYLPYISHRFWGTNYWYSELTDIKIDATVSYYTVFCDDSYIYLAYSYYQEGEHYIVIYKSYDLGHTWRIAFKKMVPIEDEIYNIIFNKRVFWFSKNKIIVTDTNSSGLYREINLSNRYLWVISYKNNKFIASNEKNIYLLDLSLLEAINPQPSVRVIYKGRNIRKPVVSCDGDNILFQEGNRLRVLKNLSKCLDELADNKHNLCKNHISDIFSVETAYISYTAVEDVFYILLAIEDSLRNYILNVSIISTAKGENRKIQLRLFEGRGIYRLSAPAQICGNYEFIPALAVEESRKKMFLHIIPFQVEYNLTISIPHKKPIAITENLQNILPDSCRDGKCSEADCSICPYDCKEEQCKNNRRCDILFGENCQTTPADCVCQEIGICRVESSFSDVVGCYIPVCGDGFCDYKYESVKNCCSDCLIEKSYCSGNYLVEEICYISPENQIDTILFKKILCSACKNNKCLPCKTDKDCYVRDKCRYGICDKESGGCKIKNRFCGSPCAENSVCDGKGNCVERGEANCRCDEMCGDNEICNIITGECEPLPEGCGNNRCDLLDCLYCRDECSDDFCNRSAFCSKIVGVTCATSPAICRCEPWSICAPDRITSRKDGCAPIICGDGICDSWEEGVCCEDCCATGKCDAQGKCIDIDYCDKTRCQDWNSSCYINKTTVCIDDGFCNNRIGELCNITSDCRCNFIAYCTPADEIIKKGKLRCFIRNIGNSDDILRLVLESYEKIYYETLFNLEKNGFKYIDIELKEILPETKKFTITITSETDSQGYFSKTYSFSGAGINILSSLYIISLGLVILLVFVIGIYLYRIKKGKKALSQDSYLNTGLSPYKITHEKMELLAKSMEKRSLELSVDKGISEVFDEIIEFTPTDSRLSIGKFFSETEVIKLNRKIFLGIFGGKDRFGREIFIEIRLFPLESGKKEQTLIMITVFSDSPAKNEIIIRYISNNLKTERFNKTTRKKEITQNKNHRDVSEEDNHG